MFYVGQKVVCINDTRRRDNYGEAFPKKGKHYTIREVTHNGEAVKLVEIVNEIQYYRDSFTGQPCFSELSFRVFRFSPIEEYSDSMSIAMQLVQELDQVDKAKNPVKEPCES